MRVYIASLTDYNKGVLAGFWEDVQGHDKYSLSEKINDFLKLRTEKTGELCEEWAIHDFEDCPIRLSEWECCSVLCQLQELIDEHGYDVVKAASNLVCGTDDIKNLIENYIGSYESIEDFGYAMAEGIAMPEIAKSYFDYKSFGRDCLMDYSWEEINGLIHVFG